MSDGKDTTCPGCGRDDFDSQHYMRIHYGQLKDEEHTGSLKYETIQCEGCGVDVTDIGWQNRKYCKKCNKNGEYLSQEQIEKISNVSGENHPFYGVTGEDHPTYQTGKDHPRWKENSISQYSRLFYQNRKKAIRRDNEKCRVCSMSRERHYEKRGRDLTVHHIDPRSEFMEDGMVRPPDEAAEMSNLFTVCNRCHGPVESGKIDIPDNGNQMDAMDW